MNWRKDKYFHLFIVVFSFVNFLQAFNTELLNDEPYYWMYSQFSSWVYLDHPPMIAWLIKAGTFFFKNEFGVRFFNTIFGTINLYLIYSLLKPDERKLDQWLLISLLASSFFLNIYSFLALPDTVLMTLATFFFYNYKNYLSNGSWKNGLLLGATISLLLYTKYHAILLVVFTLLSNRSLLKQKRFWLFVFLPAVVLYTPHIYWQVQNDFLTIRFQLFERAGLSTNYVFNYTGEQLLLTGPVFLLFFAFRKRYESQFEKALVFNAIGIFLFFFIISFFRKVNAHWTNIAWTPLLLIGYTSILKIKSGVLMKVVYGFLALNFIGITTLRIITAFNVLVIPGFNNLQKNDFVEKLYSIAGKNNVLFYDCYNEPSQYNFYTTGSAGAINNINTKRTQYNLWNFEKEWVNEKIYVVTRGKLQENELEFEAGKRKYYYMEIENYIPWHNVLEIKEYGNSCQFSRSDSVLQIEFEVINKLRTGKLEIDDADPVSLYLVCKKMSGEPILIKTFSRSDLALAAGESKTFNARIKTSYHPERVENTLNFQISVQTGFLSPVLFNNKYSIAIK